MARPNPRYEQLLQEREELSNISIIAHERLTEIEQNPSDIVSDRATEQRNVISQASEELIEVNKEIHISSEVNKIIQDLDDGKLIAPDYFASNITWVLSGHITNQAFLLSYHYLLDQGMIHAPVVTPPVVTPPVVTPPVVTPPPEQKNIYWIVKSAPPDRSGKQIEITETHKKTLENQGWVFSLTEPTPEPEVEPEVPEVPVETTAGITPPTTEEPEQMEFLCSDVYTLDNGKSVKTYYPTLSVSQIQNFISQGLMVRDCGTPEPSLEEVRSHYGYTVSPDDETIPTEKFAVSKPGRLTMSDMTNTNAWVGILIAGTLAVPVFSSILSKKK